MTTKKGDTWLPLTNFVGSRALETFTLAAFARDPEAQPFVNRAAASRGKTWLERAGDEIDDGK